MKKHLFLFLVFMFTTMISAQTAGDIDPSFVTGSGFNTVIGPRTLVTQTNGKVILGGQFTSYNGVSANRIVRLNIDGTVDTGFNIGTGFNNIVQSIALQNDGKIIVGGYFTSYNGTAANRIIRLNVDGTVDAGFLIGTGFNNFVTCILVLSDNTVIVGGAFTSYNGTVSNRAISLDPNGVVGGSLTVGFNNTVYSVAIQSGKFIVGGNFTSFDGNAVNRIVRINSDGSYDSTFISGTGFDNQVRSLAVQSDGKVVVSGAFISYNASVTNRIVRLDINGIIDPTFINGTGFDNFVGNIAIQTDGKIIAGGNFSSYNGTTANNIIRLTTTGGVDPTFNIGTGFNASVDTFIIQSDGQIMLGGPFASYNNVGSVSAIRLSNLGSKDITFSTGTGLNGNGNVWTMVEQVNGKIVAAGAFNMYNGIAANNVARLNSDGTIDSLFNIGGSGLNGGVWAMALQSDEKIVLGGSNFTTYNGIVANRIVRLNTDGTIDPAFITGTGFNSAVRGMAIQSDGKIIVGGDFTTYNGTPVGYIVRLLPSGALDTGFLSGTGFNNIVLPIVIQSNGKILVGGVFTSYNGTAANSIISLNNDGTVDTSFNIGTGFDLTPEGAKLQTDGSGKIIVVGDFNTYNGFSSKRIIRLNPDGTRDTGFNIGTGLDGDAYCSTTQPDGKIMVGGYFNNFNGSAAKYIARLNADGSNDASFVSGTSFNNGALSMVSQSTGKLIVSGAFTNYKGFSKLNIVRLETITVLGVNEFVYKKRLNLYPNPVENILNIGSGGINTLKTYEIYDIVGKKVVTGIVLENQINLNKLSKGVYVLKVNTNEGVQTSKFIKE